MEQADMDAIVACGEAPNGETPTSITPPPIFRSKGLVAAGKDESDIIFSVPLLNAAWHRPNPLQRIC